MGRVLRTIVSQQVGVVSSLPRKFSQSKLSKTFIPIIESMAIVTVRFPWTINIISEPACVGITFSSTRCDYEMRLRNPGTMESAIRKVLIVPLFELLKLPTLLLTQEWAKLEKDSVFQIPKVK